MCCCVSLCCTVYRFLSAALPKPVNGSSASAPSSTSTSAPGCGPADDEALEEQRTTDEKRPRGAKLEDAHNPISPIGSTGSLPPRSTVPGSVEILLDFVQ